MDIKMGRHAFSAGTNRPDRTSPERHGTDWEALRMLWTDSSRYRREARSENAHAESESVTSPEEGHRGRTAVRLLHVSTSRSATWSTRAAVSRRTPSHTHRAHTHTHTHRSQSPHTPPNQPFRTPLPPPTNPPLALEPYADARLDSNPIAPKYARNEWTSERATVKVRNRPHIGVVVPIIYSGVRSAKRPRGQRPSGPIEPAESVARRREEAHLKCRRGCPSSDVRPQSCGSIGVGCGGRARSKTCRRGRLRHTVYLWRGRASRGTWRSRTAAHPTRRNNITRTSLYACVCVHDAAASNWRLYSGHLGASILQKLCSLLVCLRLSKITNDVTHNGRTIAF